MHDVQASGPDYPAWAAREENPRKFLEPRTRAQAPQPCASRQNRAYANCIGAARPKFPLGNMQASARAVIIVRTLTLRPSRCVTCRAVQPRFSGSIVKRDTAAPQVPGISVIPAVPLDLAFCIPTPEPSLLQPAWQRQARNHPGPPAMRAVRVPERPPRTRRAASRNLPAAQAVRKERVPAP